MENLLLAFASDVFTSHDDRIVLVPGDDSVIPQNCVAVPVKLNLSDIEGDLLRLEGVDTPEELLDIDLTLFGSNIVVYVNDLKTDYVCAENSNVWRPQTGAATIQFNEENSDG